MNSYDVIDVAAWPRRKLFESYQSFDNKTFSVTFEADIAPLHRFAKAEGRSFFLLALYAILKAANRVPQLRQRIAGAGQVRQYHSVAAFTPIMADDGEMFAMAMLDYRETFAAFAEAALPAIAAAKSGEGGDVAPVDAGFLTLSCVPWFSFTGLAQANLDFNQTAPVLAWGKMKPDGRVPIASQFNHSLVDGLHVGRFVAAVEEHFARPQDL